MNRPLVWIAALLLFNGCYKISGQTGPDAGDDELSDTDYDIEGAWYDTSSGLYWQDKKKAYRMSWYDAVDYCKGLTTQNASDWRLPDIDEMRTLIRSCPETETNGACQIEDGMGFFFWTTACSGCDDMRGPGTTGCYWPKEPTWMCNDRFWSASSYPEIEIYAWYIDFHDGCILNEDKNTKLYVRCIRSTK